MDHQKNSEHTDKELDDKTETESKEVPQETKTPVEDSEESRSDTV